MIGEKVGDYRIVARLGSGWSGEVYRALDLLHGREVAVRLLGDGFECTPDEVERFRGQALSLTRLRHPAVAAVHDFRWYQRRGLFVMELVLGESLATRIVPGGVSWERVLGLMASPLEGIELAHRSGIIHLDLKPNNFTFETERSLRVMDFGVARLLLPGSRRAVPALRTGSPAHLAPEQVRGLGVDRRTDIYALGTVLYELLTGRTPFERDSEDDTLRAQVEEPPLPLRRFAAIPDWLDLAVQRALAKRPEDRFQSVRELRYRLLPREGMPDRRRQASLSWQDQPFGAPPPPPPLPEPEPSAAEAVDGFGDGAFGETEPLSLPVEPIPDMAAHSERPLLGFAEASDSALDPALPALAVSTPELRSPDPDEEETLNEFLPLTFRHPRDRPSRPARPSDNGLADAVFRPSEPLPLELRRADGTDDPRLDAASFADPITPPVPAPHQAEAAAEPRVRSRWPWTVAILAVGLSLAAGGGAYLLTLANRDIEARVQTGTPLEQPQVAPAALSRDTPPTPSAAPALSPMSAPAQAAVPPAASNERAPAPQSPAAAAEPSQPVDAPAEVEHLETALSAAVEAPASARPAQSPQRHRTPTAQGRLAKAASQPRQAPVHAVNRSSAAASRPNQQPSASRDRTGMPFKRGSAKSLTPSRTLPAVSTQRPTTAVVASLPNGREGAPESPRPTTTTTAATQPFSSPSTSWVAEPDEAIAAAPRAGRSLAELASVAEELRDQTSELRRIYRTYLQSQPAASLQADRQQRALNHELEQFAQAAARFDEPLQEGSFKRFLRQVPGVSGALPAPTDETSFRSLVRDLSGRASRIDQLVSAVHPSHPFNALWAQTRASWQRVRRLCAAS